MTNDKTVEAMARAICRVDLISMELPEGTDMDREVDTSWSSYADEALAAIKAHTECLMEPSEEMAEVEAAFLVILARTGIDPDIGELLLRGNPSKNVPAGVLRTALNHAFQAKLSAQEKTP